LFIKRVALLLYLFKDFLHQTNFLLQRVADMNEKMYDFEEKKRNNLVFYGIPETEGGETDDILDRKINQVINLMKSKERRKTRFIEGMAKCRQ
jgi:hypothetical protein